MSDSNLLDDPIFAEFRSEAKELLVRVRMACRSWDSGAPVTPEALNDVLRHLHTIKGNSAMFELSNTQAAAHALETFLIPFKNSAQNLASADILHVQTEADRIDDLLENFDQVPTETPVADQAVAPSRAEPKPRSSPAAPASASSIEEMIRVPLARVNDTLNYTWEIFLLRNQLSYLVEKHHASSNEENYEFLQKWEMIDSAMRRNISELESAAMGMRMRTVSVIYDRVDKVCRSYLATSAKKVEIVRCGENVEVDKLVVDLLAEPMVHLIRNALDHGIELPEVRVASGKPEIGKVSLVTRVDGDQVEITISDDGGGIDADKVLAKARACGIDIGGIEDDPDADVLGLIFHSGLSTAETITNVSGRGVGTDAVKTAVSEMGGTVRVVSELGQGTTFVIRIPLSVSVLNALLFEANGALYATSISSVVEVCRASIDELHILEDETFFDLRGTFIPCLDIRPALAGSVDKQNEQDISLVIVARGDGFVAVRVSNVVQHVELVLKKLPPLALNHSTVSGYSILHTGQPVFVLDLDELAQLAKARRHRFPREVAHAS